jgi:hypothetical protein
VLTAVVVAVCTAGCGGKARQASSTGTMSAAPTTSSGATRGSIANSTPSAAGSNRCRTADLKADIQLQKEGSAMVMLTNKGSQTCTIDGYLNYGGLLADNSAVPVTTKHEAYPGTPARFSLKPGTSGFSGLKWTSCDPSDAGCTVLAGVQVTPPEETTHLIATVVGLDGKPVPQLPLAPAGFTAGSLQPSNEGVVFP